MNDQFIRLMGINRDDKLFKKCVRKVPIDRNVYSIKELDGFKNQIGMIVPDGYVVVDIDDFDASEILEDILKFKNIECIVNTTSRGKHFIFKNSDKHLTQGANLDTVIGLKIDTRTSKKGYIILPEGSESVVGMLSGIQKRTYKRLPDQVDEIPIWLKPNTKLKAFFNKESLRIGEGSRDDTIFKYIMYLKDFTDYPYEILVDIMTIINNYILIKPMDLPVILSKINPDEFTSERRKVDKQEWLTDIAKKIIVDKMVRRYKNELYMYNGQKYIEINNTAIAQTILHEYDDLIKRTDRKEIIDFIHDYVIEEREQDLINTKYQVATPDYMVDLRTLERSPNDGTVFNTSHIMFNFLPNLTTNKFVDDYMAGLFETAAEINLIYEMIGYSMLSHLPFRKSFYLIGPAQKGKSFLVDRIKVIFGIDNIAAIDPLFIDRDPRMAKQLKDALINVPDDLSKEPMRDEALFKKCISGELIEIDVKNKEPIKFWPTATFIMTSNYLPTFRNNDEGIYSRLIFIKFEKTIKPVADFVNEWTPEHYEYITHKSIVAINRALKNGEFSIPKKVSQNLMTFKIEDNPALQFIEEVYPDGIQNGTAANMVYSKYKIWATENNYYKLNRKAFQTDVLKNTHYTLKQTTTSADSDKSNKFRFMNEN